MQSNKTTNKQNNKTVNLSRAIMMLVKNVSTDKEKTLLTKIETASYDLIDTTHNDKTKINDKLSYLYDLMIMAGQVNLFLEENTIFIMSVISEISKSYETKLLVKNEEIINEKIRDILQGGEMSETEYTNNFEASEISKSDISKRQEEIKREIKTLEKVSETKSQNFNYENKKIERLEIKNVPEYRKIEKQDTESVKDTKSAEGNRKLGRREEVLKVLSKTPVSIKDVSEKVLGCSEKTLQRELNTLVDLNLAVRIGEKRWSKYILA